MRLRRSNFSRGGSHAPASVATAHRERLGNAATPVRFHPVYTNILSKSCPAGSSCRSRKPPHAGALPCIGRPVLCSRTARGQRRKGDVPRRFALTILEEVRAAGRRVGIGRFPPHRSVPGRQPAGCPPFFCSIQRVFRSATRKKPKRPDLQGNGEETLATGP